MGLGITPFFRLMRAGFVFLREGLPGLLAPPELPPNQQFLLKILKLFERRGVAADKGQRLSEAFARLGPSYIKLGQFLATRADVVGKDVARTLSRLQDSLPAFPNDEAKGVVRDAFGKPVAELFTSFGPAIAAASIAQVHKATIIDENGEERAFAVKVLRPGVRRRFAQDLESYYLAARLIERFHEPSRRLRPVAVVDTLARSVALEMDLRLEAAALSEMAENTANDPGFRVPGVDWTRIGRNVLTLEWIDGIKLNDFEALEKAGFDLPKLGANVIQSFLRHAMRDGFFHADMHPGNLFVEEDGTLVAVDLGIMGRLKPDERRFLAEILFGFIRRDYRRVSEVHFEAGYVPPHQDIDTFAQSLRAIGEPIHGHTASEISMARLLTQLFENTELFDMETRPELILLQKTMVVVEGVGRTLDPELDMWHTSEPVVREWIEGHLGPAAMLRDTAGGVGAVGRIVRDLPMLAERAERISADLARMGRDGFRFDAATAEAIGKAEARHTRSGRIALWIIAISMAAMAFAMY
ncbi:MAG: 2-polyprenylphenol 6-hydroxylase [Hyphomicrobiales bacterium]|nr:MAG: 2-polyprenylphenol 6-hydroxylase [Hyphomicrobiales bacterium]